MYIYIYTRSIDRSIYLSIYTYMYTVYAYIYMVAHHPKKRRDCFNCVVYMYNMCYVFVRIIRIYICVCVGVYSMCIDTYIYTLNKMCVCTYIYNYIYMRI
jgi:hypothetical protein